MKNKKKLSLTTKNYTKVPNEIMRLDLPVDDVGLFTYLLSLPEEFNPSIGEIKKHFNSNYRKVNKSLANLETCGIIKKIQDGNFAKRIPVKYEFRPKTEWRKYNESKK